VKSIIHKAVCVKCQLLYTESCTSVQHRLAINAQTDIRSRVRTCCVSTSKQNALKYCQNTDSASK